MAFSPSGLKTEAPVAMCVPFCWCDVRYESFCGGGSAPSAACQVDVRPHRGYRVASRVDSIHSWEWVKDHLPAFRGQFVHALLDGKEAELHLGSSLRPDG